MNMNTEPATVANPNSAEVSNNQTSKTMLSLRNITKYYPSRFGRRYALKNVSIDLPWANIAVMGPNGAGKSTLLRIIGGTEFPNAGTIETQHSISWPLALGTGFQGSLSGRDNTRFVCRIHGIPEQQLKEKEEFVKEFSELGDYFELPIKTYSSGMRSRFNFAVSMIYDLDFDIFLLDEITSVGDYDFQKKSEEALQRKKESSRVILVSHEMSLVEKICDVGLFISDGKATIYEDLAEAIAKYREC
jgi:capsular polysaccharide transport system ATP-binding protein